MTGGAAEAIARQAALEGKASKTRLILFSRRRDDLRRIGARRLRAGSNTAPPLVRAHRLKEDLLDLCTFWRPRVWEGWKEKAARLREPGEGISARIDYAGVIALIDNYADAITRYGEQVVKGLFREYEKTLAALAELPATGARSFAGTRAAILQRFGRRRDSVGDIGDDETSEESSFC